MSSSFLISIRAVERDTLGPIQCSLASLLQGGSPPASSTYICVVLDLTPWPHVFEDIRPKGLLSVFLAPRVLFIFSFHSLHWVLCLSYMMISLSWFHKRLNVCILVQNDCEFDAREKHFKVIAVHFTRKNPVHIRHIEMPY